MSSGSTYGAGLYSAGEYSWLTVWWQIACEAPIERPRPLPPVEKPNWVPIVCDNPETRRGNSIHGH